MKTCTCCGKGKPESEYGKHSTGHTMRYCIDCHLAKRRAQHAAAKEHRNALFRARYVANANGVRDKMAAYRKKAYQKKGRAALKAWMAANPEKVKAAARNKMRRKREALDFSYVRRLLIHPDRSIVRELPNALIEAKRLQIAIERMCREKRG